MTDGTSLAVTPAPAELTDAQRKRLLATTRRHPKLSTVALMRKARIPGTRGQLHRMLDDDLKAEMREARGWSVETAADVLYQVAIDPSHPHWQRANALFLKAYGGGEFQDLRRTELTGADGGPLRLIAGRFDPGQLTTEELHEIRRLIEKAKPRGELRAV